MGGARPREEDTRRRVNTTLGGQIKLRGVRDFHRIKINAVARRHAASCLPRAEAVLGGGDVHARVCRLVHEAGRHFSPWDGMNVSLVTRLPPLSFPPLPF